MMSLTLAPGWRVPTTVIDLPKSAVCGERDAAPLPGGGRLLRHSPYLVKTATGYQMLNDIPVVRRQLRGFDDEAAIRCQLLHLDSPEEIEKVRFVLSTLLEKLEASACPSHLLDGLEQDALSKVSYLFGRRRTPCSTMY